MLLLILVFTDFQNLYFSSFSPSSLPSLLTLYLLRTSYIYWLNGFLVLKWLSTHKMRKERTHCFHMKKNTDLVFKESKLTSDSKEAAHLNHTFESWTNSAQNPWNQQLNEQEQIWRQWMVSGKGLRVVGLSILFLISFLLKVLWQVWWAAMGIQQMNRRRFKIILPLC